MSDKKTPENTKESFSEKLDKKAEKLEQKIKSAVDKLEASTDSLDKKLGQIDLKLENSFEVLESDLENTFETIESKLETTFETIEHDIETKLDALESRLDGRRRERLERAYKGEEEPDDIVLEVKGLKKYFPRPKKDGGKSDVIRAVDGLDLRIVRGETLGIVGESGCGKSTAARCMIGLLQPTAGSVFLNGRDMGEGSKQDRRELRAHTGIIFQDPYGSMDPRMSVGEIVSEPLRAGITAGGKSTGKTTVWKTAVGNSAGKTAGREKAGWKTAVGKKERLLSAMSIMESCGLQADDLFKFPHQFSGGQRQRICIARALIANPDLVVCDEAVSALDVSIQAQIINLLIELREKRDLTYAFISHDLEVVRFIADRVAVMYLGKIVELARRDELFSNPRHPYTIMLLESAPVFGGTAIDTDLSEDPELTAQELQTGCRFRNRCAKAKPECAKIDPGFKQISKSHVSACIQI